MANLSGGVRRFANRIRILFLHPLARRSPVLTVIRWMRWNMLVLRGSGSLAFPFVGRTKIRVTTRNIEARAHICLGLAEFEDMGFVLHAVRPGDLFVDVGAYVGGYTLLASGACGAYVIAIEPDPQNRDDLSANVALNGLETMVDVRPVALGADAEMVRMSAGGSISHVLVGEADPGAFAVEMDTLDAVVGERTPTFLKIDVEGFERRVLAGGSRTLASTTLLAVLIELNSSGLSYGDADESVHDEMLRYGFHSFRYEPWTRSLVSLNDQINRAAGNTLYIRDLAAIERRVKESTRHRLHGIRL
jgi:FkbM family methyltransferase